MPYGTCAILNLVFRVYNFSKKISYFKRLIYQSWHSISFFKKTHLQSANFIKLKSFDASSYLNLKVLHF